MSKKNTGIIKRQLLNGDIELPTIAVTIPKFVHCVSRFAVETHVLKGIAVDNFIPNKLTWHDECSNKKAFAKTARGVWAERPYNLGCLFYTPRWTFLESEQHQANQLSFIRHRFYTPPVAEPYVQPDYLEQYRIMVALLISKNRWSWRKFLDDNQLEF